MKRSLLAAGAAAVLALGLFSPVAFADEATGPDTAACEAATSALAEAPTEIENPDLAALQEAVQTAVDAQTPLAVPGDLGATKAELERLKSVQEERDVDNYDERVAAIKTVLNAEAALAAADPMVANPALEGLEAAKTEACETPAGEEPPAGSEAPDEQGSEDGTEDKGTETSTEKTAEVTVPTGGDDSPLYENCDAARAAGAAPVYATDLGYHEALDSDLDGIGCEDTYDDVADLVNTGVAGSVPVGSVDTGA